MVMGTTRRSMSKTEREEGRKTGCDKVEGDRKKVMSRK